MAKTNFSHVKKKKKQPIKLPSGAYALFSKFYKWVSLKAHTLDSMNDRFGFAEGR